MKNGQTNILERALYYVDFVQEAVSYEYFDDEDHPLSIEEVGGMVVKHSFDCVYNASGKCDNLYGFVFGNLCQQTLEEIQEMYNNSKLKLDMHMFKIITEMTEFYSTLVGFDYDELYSAAVKNWEQINGKNV